MKMKKKMKKLVTEIVREISDLDSRTADIEHNIQTHLVHDHGYVDTGDALVNPNQLILQKEEN